MTEMGIQCYIGMEYESGTVIAIYCSYDGFIKNGVGQTLLTYWNDKEKIRDLISKGSVMYLGKDVNDNLDSNFPKPDDEWNLYYKSPIEFKNVDDYYAGLKYVYLFKNEKWFVKINSEKFIPLSLDIES